MDGTGPRTGSLPGLHAFPWVLFGLVFVFVFLFGHDLRFAERFEETVTTADPTETVAAIAGGSLRRQAGGLALGALGILSLFLPRRRRSRVKGFLCGLIVFFLAWNYLSMLWSDDPALSFRRLVMLTMLVLGALAVAERTWPRHILLFTLLMTGGYLAIGIGIEAYLGTLRPMGAGYRFCGTLHPNTQATNCALLSMAALFLLKDARGGWRVILVGVLAVAFAFLFFTKSRAGVAGTGAALVTYWALARSGSGRLMLISATVTAVALVFLFGTVMLPLLRTGVDLGRERSTRESFTTLTGRTPLWKECFTYIGERPLLGYGYDAFWNSKRTADLTESQGWVIAHGHNVYIDLALQLGPVGVIAFVIIFLGGIARALAYQHATGKTNYAFLGTVLMFCVLDGVLDSLVLERTVLTLVIMYAMICLAFQAPPDVPEPVASREQGGAHPAQAAPTGTATA